MLEITRNFESVASIQNKIKKCKVRESKFQRIINNLNLKKELFSKLDRYYSDVENARIELANYEGSIAYKYFRFFPPLRSKYNAINNKYINCLDVFNNAIHDTNISDISTYSIHANNFNRHYSKLDMLYDLLKSETNTKNELTDTLNGMKARVLKEYSTGISCELPPVVKTMPSEQVLILKNIVAKSNLTKIDYASLHDLYNTCSDTLANLEREYEKISFRAKSLSKATEALILYKKSFLNRNKLSSSDKKMIIKAKAFMQKHGIKTETELNEKELKCRKQLDVISQNIDEMSIKKAHLSSLCETFKKDVSFSSMQSLN